MKDIPIAFIDDDNTIYESENYVNFKLEDKDKEIEKLKKENYSYHTKLIIAKGRQKVLEDIIKEAREYIQDRYDGEVLTHTFDKDNVKELLEILDKVNK